MILLIDDDPGLSEVIELLLGREGYALKRAGTVKAGLECARGREIDLVITDLKLPDGTGLNVITAIRAVRPALPIIMITSYSSVESAVGALRAGAVDYIIKPFDNDELLHAVARALNERRMRRENTLLKRNLRSAYKARPIIGESEGIRRVLDEIAAPQGPGGDARFIAATQRDLAAAVERGQFRRDVYYRLNVIAIAIPPLRERGPDRLLLAHHFAERYARKLGKRNPAFDAEFSAFIENYAWPGNVRELENLIERAVILAEGPELTGRDLAEVAPALPMVRAATPMPGGARPLAIEEYIREVIECFQDSHSETELARMLGIGRKALWMRRRQWGLKRAGKTGS
jgi:DNA-binding NtrC family response regulator